MVVLASCPICGPVYGGKGGANPPNGDYIDWECDICGRFQVTGNADSVYIAKGAGKRLTDLERAVLSHRLSNRANSEDIGKISTDLLQELVRAARLPHPFQQATNLITLIGNHVRETGNPYLPDEKTLAQIGVIDQGAFRRLREQLIRREEVMEAGKGSRTNSGGGQTIGTCYDLTLEGWEKYEDEKKGHVTGTFGFIALKFDDPILDPFLRRVIKPSVKEGLGYDLVDMRDVAQAGVIDNIMRAQIRESAFVLVDLTHDNYGAYWEAGYAEGLGKPVIYLCEKNKFESAQTHFDTNHCTTVMWSTDENDHDLVRRQLLATLGRSLNLFPEIAD